MLNAPTKARDISTLNGLVSVCQEAATAYREASTQSRNISLSKLYHARSLERDMIARRMQAHIAVLRGSELELGSLARPARTMILDVHALVGDSALAAILEVERGEQAIDAAFTAAMNATGISDDVRSMVMAWYTRIFQGQDEVAALKTAIA